MGKSLRESAADILHNSAVQNQEPFGAGKNPQSYAPQPGSNVQDLGGAKDNLGAKGSLEHDPLTNGIAASKNLVKPAQPPGVVGLDKGENPYGPGPVQNPNSVSPKQVSVQDDDLPASDNTVTGVQPMGGHQDEDFEDSNDKKEIGATAKSFKTWAAKLNSVHEEPEVTNEEDGGDHSAFETDTTNPNRAAREFQSRGRNMGDNPDSQNSPGIPQLNAPTAGGISPTPDGVEAEVKAYFNSKGAAAGQVQEDIEAIFAGSNLSKAFKTKAAKIFEAAVISAATDVSLHVASKLEEEYVTQLETVTEGLKNQLAEQVDDYLNYMVEQWVQENEVAIEKGIRAELTEDFIKGLRNLFVEHYIDIPEDKVPVVEELASEVESLEKKLSEELERNVRTTKALNEYRKLETVRTVCEGLTETQISKMIGLSETVDFTNIKEYKNALTMLRENYYPSKSKTVKSEVRQLDEESVEGDVRGVVEDKADDLVAASARALSQTKN